jgi:hypothetical protein
MLNYGEFVMKKVLLVALIVGLVGCGGFGAGAQHAPGFIYNETKVPAWDLTVATTTDMSTRSGTATCKSILGLFSTGDCTVEAAKKAAGVTKVNNVEFDVKNILGVYAEYTTKVYGQ